MAIIITASTNYTLGAGEDNLQLTGSADVNGTGNAGNNFLTGNDGANVLIGGAGGDFLLGGAGDDILIGNVDSVTADAEADYLNGEDGNDIIYLTGRDMTDGGAGADTYWVMTGRNNHIWDTGTDTSVDVVKTYTSVTMGSFNFDTSKPYAMIYDGIERVELQGTANLSAVGGLGNETLIGNSGNNLLDGGGGVDVLDGGAGNDTLHLDSGPAAQQGATLTGGAGNDVFRFQPGYSGDHSQGADSVVITDFTQGADILSFGLPAGIAAPSAIHTLTVQAGDTLASLLTQAIHQTTTYTQPALSQFVLDGDTYLVMDTTADPTWAASDLAIKLTGAHTLSMTDISFG